MTDRLSIALAQLNPIMGDFPGNLARARAARAEARAAGADLILFSELYITGYPPEDLVLKPVFQKDAMDTVEAFAEDLREAYDIETLPFVKYQDKTVKAWSKGMTRDHKTGLMRDKGKR